MAGSFLSRLDIATSGMAAQRLRSDVIAQNVANAETTRTIDGTPYRRQVVVFAEIRPYKNIDPDKITFGDALKLTLKERLQKKLGGVKVTQIVEDQTPLTPVYDPTHPDADEDGYYYLPNVDVAEEQMDLLATTRSYEASASVYEGLLNMALRTLNLGRG
ncbi:MAG: flagellar basal body rod protein FlgC [Oscillospiraceae bacterium]|jgi:flagellar basal-body rod protein FlgC|nr:flagellar basal body rod protein FlgC [Oscillospiraceae bacterium]